MPRRILETLKAKIGNTTDNWCVIIAYDEHTKTPFFTYMQMPNGKVHQMHRHYTLTDALENRESLMQIRRQIMTENLEIAACG